MLSSSAPEKLLRTSGLEIKRCWGSTENWSHPRETEGILSGIGSTNNYGKRVNSGDSSVLSGWSWRRVTGNTGIPFPTMALTVWCWKCDWGSKGWRTKELRSGRLCSSEEHQPQNECYVQLRVRSELVSVNGRGRRKCIHIPAMSNNTRLLEASSAPHNSL